jgi:hypothetical protein
VKTFPELQNWDLKSRLFEIQALEGVILAGVGGIEIMDYSNAVG